MQILVIGAFGYIGSQVLESLGASRDYRDARIVAVDNWSYGRGMAPLQAYFKGRLRNFEPHCIDLSDRSSAKLRELVAASDYVINVASLTQVPSNELHTKYILHGVENLIDMLLAGPGRLRKVIDISSTSIYGPVKTRMPGVKLPYGEDVTPDPALSFHNYAENKLKVETLWQAPRCNDLPWTDFRLSTVFGYSVGMRYNQFIGQFLVDACAGRETILPGAPDNYRPFCHVRDCAELMLHLFENDRGTNGHVINIGARTLNPRLGDLFADLAALLRQDYGITARYRFFSEIDTPPFEEDYQVDFTKFETMVGFRLKYDFERGARELVDKVLGRS